MLDFLSTSGILEAKTASDAADFDLRLSSATALHLPSACSVDMPTSAPFRPPVFHLHVRGVANASKEHTAYEPKHNWEANY